MDYQQILPIEPLRRYIRYFWALKEESDLFTHKTFRVIPDGLPGLIFQENPKAIFEGNEKKMPQLFLYGQTTKHTQHIAKEHFHNIGVYFQPTALKSIFGIDANELTDLHINIDDLIKTTLTDQLANSKTLTQRIQSLSTFFLQKITQRKPESEKVNFAIIQLQRGKDLKSIQADLDLSERTLERYFKSHIGIPPKLYARINRFQSSLENLRQSNFDILTDIAYRNDYFDQSHHIREFREFTGICPSQFLLQANEQVPNYTEWKK